MKLFTFKKKVSPEKEGRFKEGRFSAGFDPYNPIDDDDHLYRRLGQTQFPERDLLPVSQDRMIQLCYKLFDSNPIARAIILLLTDFMLGDIGIKFKTNNKKVQKSLERFWDINELGDLQYSLIKDLFVYGELILPAKSLNGNTSIGYIDPYLIEKIHIDHNNSTRKHSVDVRVVSPSGLTSVHDKLYVINRERNIGSSAFGLYNGDVFVFNINAPVNASRGRSELLPVIDWLSAYQDFLWRMSNKAQQLNSYVYDVSIDGADNLAIEQWKKAHGSTLKSGSTVVHSSNEKWNVLSPNMKDFDCTPIALIFVSVVSGAFIIPRHWLSFPDDANRAVSSEMSEPTMRHLKAKQRVVKNIFHKIFKFHIDQSKLSGKIPISYKYDVLIELPEVSPKTLEKIARAYKHVLTATSDAVESGIFTVEEGRKTIDDFFKDNVIETKFDAKKKTQLMPKKEEGDED